MVWGYDIVWVNNNENKDVIIASLEKNDPNKTQWTD